jgi:hypothetical protein
VELAPGAGGVVAVQERRAAHQLGERAGAHAGLLRAGRRGPERPAPALLHRRLADRRPGARRARHRRRIGAGQRARVLGRLDDQPRVGRARLLEVERSEAVEVDVARRCPEPLGLAGQLGAQQRPRLALEQLALERQQQRRGQRRRAHEHLLARLHIEAVAGEEPGEGAGIRGHGACSSGK